MQVDHTELEQRLASLADNFTQLGQYLRQAAEGLVQHGRPISIVTMEELKSARRDFDKFRDAVFAAAGTLELAPLPAKEEVTDLRLLEEVVLAIGTEQQRRAEARRRAEEEARRKAEEEARRTAEEEARRKAQEEARRRAEEEARRAAELARTQAAGGIREQTLELLDDILRIAHCTRPSFAPLLDCQRQAAQLRNTVASLTGTVTQLEEKTLLEAQQPFQALLGLMEEWNNLDSDRWDTLREQITKYFGKELATQAARGQLILTNTGAAKQTREAPTREPQPKASVIPLHAGLSARAKAGRAVPLAPEPAVVLETEEDEFLFAVNPAFSLDFDDEPPNDPPPPPPPPGKERMIGKSTNHAGANTSVPPPSWFSRLQEIGEGAPAAAAAQPPVNEAPMPTAVAATPSRAAEPPAPPKLADAPSFVPNSTLSEVAFSHWSTLLNELTQAEAQAAAEKRPGAAPLPPLNELLNGQANTQANEQSADGPGERASPPVRIDGKPPQRRNSGNLTPQRRNSGNLTPAARNSGNLTPPARDSGSLTPPVQNTDSLTPPPALPTPPAPPPAPPFPTSSGRLHFDAPAVVVNAGLPAETPAAAANASEGDADPADLDTVPLGFEDEDEKKQIFHYLALEEKKAPFYFAEGPAQPLYHFSPGSASNQIALAVENSGPKERNRGLRDLIWRLVFEEQYGFAFFLARALERQHPEQRPCLPSWLVRVAALGSVVRYDEGEVAQMLKSDFRFSTPNWVQSRNDEWNQAVTLLTAAAAMRSALLSPSTQAPNVLLKLPQVEGLGKFHEYCQAVGRYCRDSKPIDPVLLKKSKELSMWQVEMNLLRSEVETWWKQAPLLKMEFAPATYVWRNWLEAQGTLRAMLPPNLPDSPNLSQIRKHIKHWSDEKQVRRTINHTDRQLLGRSTGQRDIEGDAFKQLFDRVREAVDLARRWVVQVESKPGSTATAKQSLHIAPLKHALDQLREPALTELEKLTGHQASICLLVSLAMCRDAVAALTAILDPNHPFTDTEPTIRHALYAPLIATGLPLDWRWKPATEDRAEVIAEILKVVIQGPRIDWEEAFARHVEAGDHEATGRILQYLDAAADDRKMVEALRSDRERKLQACRDALKQDIEGTRKLIAGALDFGYLSEKDYLTMAATIDKLEAGKMQRFAAPRAELEAQRDALAGKRTAAIAVMNERLQLSNVGPDNYYHPQICRVLERGDIVTAEEYLAMLLDHQELPETEDTKDYFAVFYPDKAREISEYLKQIPLYAVIQRARSGADLCGLRLKDFDLEAVGSALSSWFNSRKMQAINEEEAGRILSFIGFAPKKIELNAAGGTTWIDLMTDPILGREHCPIPYFGSEAQGRYRVLCVWNRPSEEELFQRVGDTALGSPVIIFYFGQMTEEMRLALGRLCRERRQTFIVIDDILMLYLYGQRAPRRRVTFDCTLPFTWTEPYTATSVPPEMFFGRAQERKSIMSATGSGFVFGGRRLGKTALLRDVQRNFHAPDEGRVAVFLDLEGENIGTQRQLDDLWLLIGEEMKRLNIASGSHNNPVHLLEQICDWLDKDPQRRILLLLDQSDRFLEADEQEQFVRASRLRGVTEKTNRRFKVVFAGVHNIPRLTRVADHPLAQFGTPLSIGPLLGHEAHEARKLIEEPLGSLGYRFESPDLVRRILWRTNYYPSLVQHYCHHLLKFLTNPNRKGADKGPPYYVSSEDVDEAYRSQDLRAAIRAGLLLTLQVDERYGVIAYVMADAILQSGEQSLTEGFSISWVSQQCSYWWAEGFHSVIRENSLSVLLDEMIGLGIVRGTDNGYTLRSKGVAVLLGNEEQIAAELQRIRQAPPKYNPNTFRAARTGSPRRSPLTAQEIHELRSPKHGVSVIFGSEASGLPDLREFLEMATPRKFFTALDEGDHDKYIKQLNKLVDREQNGTTVMLVSPKCPWTDHWIADAHKRLGELTARRSFVRVAFVADPAKTWQLLTNQARPFELLPGKQVSAFSLKPWHDDALRLWLDDRGFNIDGAGRERILGITGNWQVLLEYYYQHATGDVYHWLEHLRATAKDLEEKPIARDFLRLLGIDPAAIGDVALDIKRVLLALETHGELSVAALAAKVNTSSQEVGEDTIKRTLWWAEMLNLVCRDDHLWRVDHIVGRMLQTVSS